MDFIARQQKSYAIVVYVTMSHSYIEHKHTGNAIVLRPIYSCYLFEQKRICLSKTKKHLKTKEKICMRQL